MMIPKVRRPMPPPTRVQGSKKGDKGYKRQDNEDEMREEYDFSGAVRGKYYARYHRRGHMLTDQNFQAILGNIRYQRGHDETWVLILQYDDNRPYFQVMGVGSKDPKTGEVINWKGRKWLLSPHMCVSEVVRTAFKAMQTAEEHELCEYFLYKNAAIYSPHRDVDSLVQIGDDIDTREERRSKVP